MSKAWVLALCLAGGAVHAAPICRLTTVGELAFGNYDPMSAVPTDSAVTLRVTCDGSGRGEELVLDVGLGPGRNSGTANARKLSNAPGTDFLQYGLFRDAARSSPWGSSSGIDTGGHRVTVPAHGSVSVSFTIYARIPPKQDVAAGSYGDTVQLTVTP